MHGIKYCSMRNYVLGLEMVMPDGNMLKVGAKMVKSVAGYDLARLMVGAQGIMGIVTSATLKVLPMPEDRRVLVFEFPDGAGAAAAAQEMIDEGLGPAALEIADPLTVGAARGAPEDACRAELLVEFHGTKSLCEGDASEVKAMVMARPEASAAAEAGYPEALNLWKVRRSALAALAATWPALLLMDLALPRGRMEGMVKEIDEISKRHRTRIAVFGHAGEGRLHAAVPADGAAEDAVSEITNACVNWGGVVSAEMGTGLRAARLPRASLSETGREVLGILKRSIDPEGMMNPGKLLDEG
jgi:glycolate oxidase